MIEAFSLKTAHYFGDALASQARLRYRVFVQDRGLAHASYDDMEYDEFDTPAATYLVWRDAELIVRGLIRVVPTSVPYMAEKYWPSLFQSRDLPKRRDIWETSRVCVDRGFDPETRKVIMPELLCGLQEFCLANDVEAVVGVTRRPLLDGYLPGGVEWLCAPVEVEGNMESAFWTATQNIRPDLHCSKFGLRGPFLSFMPAMAQVAA